MRRTLDPPASARAFHAPQSAPSLVQSLNPGWTAVVHNWYVPRFLFVVSWICDFAALG
jgi:hypothetical protein